MPKEDLKKLPPEERIKRLKQLEEEKRKEIAEAQQEIHESEDEIKEQRKWREKVPIPEVAKEELEGLSEEGKVVVKVHKGLREKKVQEEAEGEVTPTRARAARSRLEEAVERERTERVARGVNLEYGIPTAAQPLNVEYTQQLSRRPIEDLYREVAALSQTAQERGYVTAQDQRMVEYRMSAIDEKRKAAEEGRYSFTEETARFASIAQQMGSTLQSMYRKDKGTTFEHDWYKGR